MNQNIGKLDRILRIALGVALLAAGWIYQSWWGLVGLLPLGTAAIGWCGPYALLGISTRGKSA